MDLYYKRYSETGQPLLVLHGLFGSQSNWGWHCKQLAETYQVIGVDLRNHGESPHADEHNYQVMAADVKSLMKSLNFDSCYMLGHSMGGKVAMEVALSAPELVDKLLVVDIAPVKYIDKADGHMAVMAGMNALDLSTLKSRADAEEQLAGFIKDEATRKFVVTNLTFNAESGFSWRLNLPVIEANYNRLREQPSVEGPYEKPTLFVKGDLSEYIQAKHEAQILKLFPNAGVKIIVEAGHWLHADKPQAFQKVAMDFFSDN
ncbi:MAG: esterase [Pseudohongiellaceae bacterium]|jgi:esterase